MEEQLVEKKKEKKQSAFRFTKLNSILDSFMDDQGSWRINYGGLVITLRLVTYTPELAARIIEDYNSKNRKITKGHVTNLIKEIVNNKWLPNGDTITFDIDGNLADGQHRLLAIVGSGISLQYLTITGIDEEAFKTIDINKVRDGGDALSIEGITNSSFLASMMKAIYAFKNGKYSQNKHHYRTLSNSALIEYFYELGEDKLNKSYRFYNKVKEACKGFISPSNISSLHFIMSEIDEEQATDFLTKLCEGSGLQPGSPIAALRNKIWKSKIDKNYKLTNEVLLANIVYAWNKYRDGKTSKSIKLPNDFEMKLK